ncbi:MULTISPECIES: hypothetical protein [Streptomyces]|uniref:Uncharacterized protein n=1 Tax=Streptomyces venezuelae TaxID=54571 RepID=A0A5P2ALN9_STRVZ|nr:hypothetical protein [Streptomyces venezuelae]QES19113.1 hypothetical protein DEJ46_08440 [Streptomyces venezuelae]
MAEPDRRVLGGFSEHTVTSLLVLGGLLDLSDGAGVGTVATGAAVPVLALARGRAPVRVPEIRLEPARGGAGHPRAP